VFRAVHAAASAEAGDLSTARALIERELAAGFDSTHEMQWATAMTLWASVAVRLEHHDAAAALHPLLAPFESLTAFTGLTYGGPLAPYLGSLALVSGDLENARRHLERAEEISDRSDDPYSMALTRLAKGRYFLERSNRGDDPAGDVERACEELLAARNVARSRGFARIDLDADELITRIGEP
jgi:hypothetical protein